MTVARLLDGTAFLAAAGLGLTLVFWTGRREHWPWRPEHFFLLLVGFVAVRAWLAPRPLPAVRPRRAVLIGVAAYAVVFSFITVTRHLTFATHALDLGYYVQLVWNLARGAGPYVSLPEMHAWGDHLSPIMYLFVPAYWLVPGPMVLLVAQSVALGGVAVFGLARARLGDERPAAAFALLYWPTRRSMGSTRATFTRPRSRSRCSWPPSGRWRRAGRGWRSCPPRSRSSAGRTPRSR